VGEGGRRDRRGVCVGPPGKDEVGRAWMNSVDCELFKWISNEFDLIWLKGGPTWPQKLQIKYGWKYLEIRNNFTYRIFSIFEMEFELKFKEISMSWNQRKFTGKSWNFRFQWNLASKLLAMLYCQEKSISIKRGSEIWIPFKKGKLDWFHDSLNPKLYFWIPLLDLGSY
jgi:hypothetical protein